jgi:hypothetical protein
VGRRRSIAASACFRETTRAAAADAWASAIVPARDINRRNHSKGQRVRRLPSAQSGERNGAQGLLSFTGLLARDDPEKVMSAASLDVDQFQ